MQKIYCFFAIILLLLNCNSYLSAQTQPTKVGIGTNSPQEHLDVQGNINLSGTIKTNMQTGSSGQVLQMQANGNLGWSSLCNYKNFRQYSYSNSNQSWTVPNGVYEIAIELWGAGGGGSPGGGGGAGGYVFAVVPVTPGTVLTIDIGLKGGGNVPLIAENSTITVGSIGSVSAYHGYNGGTSSGGAGGTGSGSSTISFYFISGERGKPNRSVHMEYGMGFFARTITYGDGGDAPLRPNTGGEGGQRTDDNNQSTPVLVSGHNPGFGSVPGGGGGGFNWNYTFGGDGMAIIYW